MSRARRVAPLLTLLALLSPTLTLAPIQATEPALSSGPASEAADPRPPGATAWLAAGDVIARWPAPSAPRPAAAEPTPTPVPIADRYQDALEAARGEARSFGLTFAVVRDGELAWAGSVGTARDGRTPLAPDAPMVIGSVTKTFVAATVLQLVEEGRLALDEPARDYLGPIGTLDAKITIARLLDHTSGLADVFNDTTRRGIETEPGHAWSTDELLAALHEPWYAPGEGWAYANTNYYLLGLIVEGVTGAPLADELARRFFGPLGLHATALVSPDAGAGPLGPAWSTIFWASGAMTSTAADVARWGDALYDGDVLEPASRRRMTILNDHDYGLGTQRIEIGRLEGLGHTGLLNTDTTLLVHFPDEDVTLALLVNRTEVDLDRVLRAKPANGPSLLDLALGR